MSPRILSTLLFFNLSVMQALAVNSIRPATTEEIQFASGMLDKMNNFRHLSGLDSFREYFWGNSFVENDSWLYFTVMGGITYNEGINAHGSQCVTMFTNPNPTYRFRINLQTENIELVASLPAKKAYSHQLTDDDKRVLVSRVLHSLYRNDRVLYQETRYTNVETALEHSQINTTNIRLMLAGQNAQTHQLEFDAETDQIRFL